MEKNKKTRLIALALSLTTLASNTSCETVGKSNTTIKTSKIVTTQPTLEPVITEETEINEKEFVKYMNVQDLYTNLTTYIYTNRVNTITDEIREYMNVELTEEQKERYDTLLEKTLEQTEKCIKFYEANDINNFKKTYDRLCTSSECINIKDLVEIYALAINKLYDEDLLTNENYNITDNSLIIDGVKINNIRKREDEVDTKDPFTVLNYYSDNEYHDEETMDIINILEVKMAVLSAIKNVRITLDTNTNELYTYSKESLKKHIIEKKQQLSSECDVFSWEYDIEQDAYIVYNKYGIGNICKNNSYITNALDDIFELEQFQRYSDQSDNIEKIKEIMNKKEESKKKTR